MPDVSTVHDGTETYRDVTTDDGETHRFLVVDPRNYEYQGDGQPPQAAQNALDQWVADHHGPEEQTTEQTQTETTGNAEGGE